MRVLLADDHEIVLQGLRMLLEAEGDIEVVAAVGDGGAAVREAARCKPAVAVLDVSMGGLNGIDATRQITGETPGVRVLCLSMHTGRTFVRAAMSAGAVGYIPKDCAVEELVTAIRVVNAGQCYLSPVVAGHVIEAARSETREEFEPKSDLSRREREILQLISEGISTREIAERLHVSHRTVGTHRGNIMKTLGIHTVAGLTKYAIRRGMTTLDH